MRSKRAGKLFFREQKASTEDGAVNAWRPGTIETHASGSSLGSLGRLIVESQAPLATVNLEVLDNGKMRRPTGCAISATIS